MSLTDLQIQKLPVPDKGQKVYYEPSGLGVRVSQGGSKSFVVQVGAKRSRRTLGRYPKMTLREARREALKVLNEYDPAFLPKTSQNAILSFLEACARKNKPRTVKDYTRILNKHFPKGNLQAQTRQKLLTTLNALSHTPAEQFHATAVFQTFLNWCVATGTLQYNPIAGIKNQGSLKNRDRILDDDELKAIWQALPTDRYGTYMKLMILTGQRKSEIPHITITDDLAHIPAEFTKNGIAHTFPVGTMTLEHFDSVQWNGWSKSKARVDKASGVTGWTYHDLRRTFASNHARLGTPIHVVEKLLNHVSGSLAGVAGVYNRYSYMDEMREACIRYEEWLSSLVRS